MRKDHEKHSSNDFFFFKFFWLFKDFPEGFSKAVLIIFNTIKTRKFYTISIVTIYKKNFSSLNVQIPNTINFLQSLWLHIHYIPCSGISTVSKKGPISPGMKIFLRPPEYKTHVGIKLSFGECLLKTWFIQTFEAVTSPETKWPKRIHWVIY